ncbi:MAG: DUF6973 domain-containing protein [Candidatus Gastranaerophilaceae bacterium]
MNKQNNNKLSTQDRIKFASKIYNDKILRKTMEYQKKYGFELNPRQGHELWNVEGDAFKHAFMGADMALNLGQIPSLVIGIYHENETPNNPSGEWNMDSWNNQQGREIAKEIQKEYGKVFSKLPQKQQDDIIAEKIMQKMKAGQLITNPSDNRKFNGFFEKVFNNTADLSGKTTGQAAPINQQNSVLFGYTNPLTGNNRIFTREEVGTMTPDEFAKYEKEIDAQIKAFGGTMPTNGDLQREAMTGGGVVYVNSYTRSDGTKVNGYYRSKPRF